MFIRHFRLELGFGSIAYLIWTFALQCSEKKCMCITYRKNFFFFRVIFGGREKTTAYDWQLLLFSFSSFSFLLLTVQYDAMWVEWRLRKMKRRGRKIAKQRGMEKKVERIRRAIIIIICRNRNVFREFSVVCLCVAFVLAFLTQIHPHTHNRQRDGKICCCNCMRWMWPWSFIKFITHLDVWVRTGMCVPVCVWERKGEQENNTINLKCNTSNFKW